VFYYLGQASVLPGEAVLKFVLASVRQGLTRICAIG
jgi:hypothetical protein